MCESSECEGIKFKKLYNKTNSAQVVLLGWLCFVVLIRMITLKLKKKQETMKLIHNTHMND